MSLIPSNDNIEQIAALIVERRIKGSQGESFPEHLRPQTIEDALAIQQEVTKRWCDSQDDLVGGWKCLEPSSSATVIAPIYARTINSVAPVPIFAENGVARIEPELAFFVGEDLPARDEPYTEQEIDAVFTRAHMALELLHCRFLTPEACSFPEKLADGLVNQGLFIGPQVPLAQAKAAATIAISVTVNGITTAYAGTHPNGDPVKPLYWLVEFLRGRGLGLEKGQAIITGSFAGVIEVPFGKDVKVVYDGLGEMQVHFTQK